MVKVTKSILANIGKLDKPSPVVMSEAAKLTRFDNTEFRDNFHNYIKSENGEIDIVNSKFLNGSGSPFVSVKGAKLSVSKNTTFSNNYNENGSGMGIECISCTSLVVEETSFEKMNTTSNGAAINL